MRQNIKLQATNIFAISLFLLPALSFYTNDSLLLKTFFIFSVGLAGFIFCWQSKKSQAFSIKLVLLFFLFVFLQVISRVPFNVMGILVIITCLLLHHTLNDFDTIRKVKQLLPSLLVVILVIEIVFFLKTELTNKGFFAPNNSIFSTLLAAQLCFILPVTYEFIAHRVKYKIPVFFSLIAIVALLLFATEGRSGLFAFLTSSIIFFLYKFQIQNKFKFVGAFLLGIFLFTILFFYKINSSNGRIMIYKIIAKEMAPTEWVTGIGYGQFIVKYNQWQANYFMSNPTYTDEVPYAENIYYAFNDPLQLVVELGIVGLLLILFSLYHILKQFRNALKQNLLNDSILFGAYLSLLSLLISSLFQYPFQVPSTYPILIFALAIIFNSVGHTIIGLNTYNIKIHYYIMAFPFLALIGIAIKILIFTSELDEAKNLSKLKYRTEALGGYSALVAGTVWDVNIYYIYAQELRNVKKLDSALLYLNKSSNFLYDDRTSKLLADIYYEKGNLLQAEKYFIQTVYINPKSYKNRYLLMSFYLETNQKLKAREVGLFIMSMPFRESEKANWRIRQQVKADLLHLEEF